MDSTTITNNVLDVEDIRRGLDKLPQELYDQIYIATFTAPTGTYCPILPRHTAYFQGNRYERFRANVNRNDLKLLHISRESRDIFARSYYGPGSTFLFPMLSISDISIHGTLNDAFIEWLEMLPSEHRGMLPRVLLWSYFEGFVRGFQLVSIIRSYLLRHGVDPANVMRVSIAEGEKIYDHEYPQQEL